MPNKMDLRKVMLKVLREGVLKAMKLVSNKVTEEILLLGGELRRVCLTEEVGIGGLRVLQLLELLFPLTFEGGCHKAVIRVHGAIVALGQLCLIANALDALLPLLIELLTFLCLLGEPGLKRIELSRLNGGKESLHDGRINTRCVDVQATTFAGRGGA